jgi:hypothetical protein
MLTVTNLLPQVGYVPSFSVSLLIPHHLSVTDLLFLFAAIPSKSSLFPLKSSLPVNEQPSRQRAAYPSKSTAAIKNKEAESVGPHFVVKGYKSTASLLTKQLLLSPLTPLTSRPPTPSQLNPWPNAAFRRSFSSYRKTPPTTALPAP